MKNNSLEDVSTEFSPMNYANSSLLREAMLQEIVDLRNKLAEVEEDFELYMEQY